MFIFHLILVVLLTVSHAKHCPSHCKCNFARDSYCTMKNSTVKLELAFVPSRFGSLSLTCEGTNFTCLDLPQLESSGVHQIHLSSCPPSVLKCLKHGFSAPIIESIILSNLSIPISNEDVKDFSNVTYLDLKLKDAATVVPLATINSWSSLLWVSITKGNLQLHPESFNHSSLIILNMVESKITNWTQGAFSGLPNLRKLAMFYANADKDSINAGTFKGLSKLGQLWLKNMSVKRIEPGAFIDTPRLEVLNLDQNPFESLPNGFLDGLKTLKSITITCVTSNNHDGLNIGSHAFANQPELRDVELGLCKLNNILDNIFNNSHNIISIDIGDNIIKNISATIFSNLTSMKHLKFDNNTVNELPEGIFNNLSSLELLSLANNGIIKLQDNIFSDLKSLNTLNLNKNNIKELPETIFATFTSLITLNLAQNQIAELPSEIFKSLTSLEELNLNDNNIRALPESIFTSLSYLETLNLANNCIEKLSADIFTPLTNLEKLDLENNRLHDLPGNMFVNFTLISLNVANNDNLQLDKNSFKHIFKLIT